MKSHAEACVFYFKEMCADSWGHGGLFAAHEWAHSVFAL